jgi:hypothetical protein
MNFKNIITIMYKKLLVISLIALSFCSCKSSSTTTDSFVSYETSCIGIEQDGSETLRAWGEGKNKADAVEQAKKNAVYDIIFKGINAGCRTCNVKPLINEVNAREKYEQYFNIFFMDGGEYKKYISSEDEKIATKERQNYKLGNKYGVTVRVLRSELKERLISDGILKK